MHQARCDFSVVISTRNRPRQLAACLTALAGLDYPRSRFEVIVVDDGSDGRLDDVVALFRDELDLCLLAQVRGGPAKGRNTGAARARGQSLAFTDDDCIPEPGWLRGLAAALGNAPDLLVGGHTLNGLPDNVSAEASQLIMELAYAHQARTQHAAHFVASNNMAMSTARFRAIGGFDEGYVLLACEDRDLCDRWLAAGNRLLRVADAVVRHRHGLTLRTFLQQHFTYGRGAVRFHSLRARRRPLAGGMTMSLHLQVHRWLFWPLQHAHGRRAVGLMLLMLLWQLANTAGFLYERVRCAQDTTTAVPRTF